MPALPTGTVTFLFTDIEGSTKLWEQFPDQMRSALARHDALLKEAIESHNGHVFKTVGDAFCAAFATASEALLSALNVQQILQKESFEEIGSLRVRMALHTGAAEERDNDYFGPALNRVARLLSIGHGEQVLLSLPAEELVKDSLPEGCSLKDMGSHRLKDLQQPEHVFQLVALDLPADFPPLRSLQAFANNLPIQLTSFIGREKEIEDVKGLLARTRLLTLTGSGGCGKTRLALQVAADLIEDYSDGVWLIELAALSDPSLVPQAVASAIGVREEPGRSLLQTLTDFLMSKRLLLLLDNCEHLLGACAELSEILLKSCPQLKLMVTSREAFRITGEQVYRVPSLVSPDPAHLPTEEKELTAMVSAYEAPRLFVERARLQRPEFILTRQNASIVASVCNHLDGIPLAIELAAARLRSLSVQDINVRLEDRFCLLTGGSRTAVPRHQTLRATIEWSYELLSPQERLLLSQLCIFVGGWSVEAAEAVCGGETIAEREVLDLLTSLVDKSLVIHEEQEGKTRYRLLETIREYGRERLKAQGTPAPLRERHLEYYLRLAEQAEPYLTGAKQGQWLERLESEHDNLRAAMSFCLQDNQRAEAGVRLAGALGPFWKIRGYWDEGRGHLEAVLSQEALRQNKPAWVKALHAAGSLATGHGDYATARQLYAESLAIRREIGDKAGIAASLNNLGLIAYNQGDYAAAKQLILESLTIKREIGYIRGIAYSLIYLGLVAYNQGDYVAAQPLFMESLVNYKEIGDKQGIASSLSSLGNVADAQGDYATARKFYEESLEIFKEAEDKWGIATLRGDLGKLALTQGDYAAAQQLFMESLFNFKEIGDKQGIAYSLSNLGNRAYAQGDYAAAREVYEESLAIFRKIEHKRGIGTTLKYLGNVADAQGDYATARMFYEESLEIFRKIEHQWGIADAISNLGNVATNQGDYIEAGALYTESLTMKKEIGDKQGIVESLEGVAVLRLAQNQLLQSTILWAAAQALREAIESPLHPNQKEKYDRNVSTAYAALGEEAFTAAWEQGQTMTIEQAIEYALEQDGHA